jgi:AraC-like DNA-binding protein
MGSDIPHERLMIDIGHDPSDLEGKALIAVNYEAPTFRYEGGLNDLDLLRCLLPCPPRPRIDGDQRIAKLTDFIDNRDGRIGWNLKDTCRELKLNISAPYAARLFKLSRGLGIRDYAKKRRLAAAAELLTTTDLSVKAIAVECGYSTPSDFTRRFKAYFRLSPSDFRTGALRLGGQVVTQPQGGSTVGVRGT